MVQNAGALLKKRQVRRCERAGKVAFTYFLTNNLARTERKLEPHCKIKDKDLRF